MRRSQHIVFWIMTLSVCVLQAHKYEPINTEYAHPVEVFILEVTPQMFNLANGDKFYLLPKVGIEMPLTGWSQIEVSVPYLLLDPAESRSLNGLGDLELGFRALLPTPEGIPTLGANFEVGAPTGDSGDELAGEATELAAGLFATQELTRATLFGNFSYAAEFPKQEDGHENILEYAMAAVFHLNRFLYPTVELFGESNITEEETELFLAPEVIFNLGQRTEAKVALPIGLTDSSPDWGVQFQFTIFLNEHPDSNLPRRRSRTP